MKRILRQIGSALHPGSSAPHDEAGFPAQANRMWMEQDLWNHQAADTALPAPPAHAQNVRTTNFDYSVTEIVRTRERQAAASRTQAGTEAYAERRRTHRAENIARLMEVNQTVKRDRGAVYRVIQKIRGVSADYDLWKGPTRQVTFLLG
jgi:hypothetical protein